MSDKHGYENHPASNLFPDMAEDEFNGHCEDIKKHGLKEPIELFEGMIIDGRNRKKACLQVGVAPRYVSVKLNGSSAIEYVISKNLHRRHLTASQKSIIYARMKPLLAEDAKQRVEVHGNTAPGRRANTVDHMVHRVKRPTRTVGAELLGIGTSTAERGARVLKADPKLAERVIRGEIRVATADKIIKARKNGEPDGDIEKRKSPAVPVQKRVEPTLDGLEIKAQMVGEFLAEKEAKEHADYGGWLKRLRKVRLCLSQTINRGGNSDGN